MRFSPPESFSGVRPASAPMFRASSAAWAFWRARSAGRPWFSNPKATSSSTVGMNSWSSGS